MEVNSGIQLTWAVCKFTPDSATPRPPQRTSRFFRGKHLCVADCEHYKLVERRFAGISSAVYKSIMLSTQKTPTAQVGGFGGNVRWNKNKYTNRSEIFYRYSTNKMAVQENRGRRKG